MKKFLIVLMALLLVGCSSSNDKEPIDKTIDYIKPLNEVNFFDVLNDEVKNTLLDIYGDENLTNNLLTMCDKKLTDIVVLDYYDNPVNFKEYQNKNFILEIVQYTCEHCLKQVPLTETIINNEDIDIIQYFAFGDKEQIDDFYEKSSFAMPKEVTVVPQNDELSSYISDLGVDATPSFIFFSEGKVRFVCTGELSYAKYLKASPLAFDNPYSKEDFVNNEGVSVFDLYRGYDDVLNDLSANSKDKLALINNSEELTVDVIGQQANFNELYEKDTDNPLYEIESYTKYINKPLVVFYVGYIHNNLEKDIGLINEFAENHKDLNMLTILMDTKDLETSPLYKASGLTLKTDVVSSNSEIVKQFLDTTILAYPGAVFIQDNVFVGGCHTIEDSQTIENAYEIFIGDNSIALVSNN